METEDYLDPQEVRNLMAAKKDTQAGLARLLGISPDKINKVFAGTRSFQKPEVKILRRYYGLDPDADQEPQRRIPVVGLISAGAWQEGFRDVIDNIPSPDPSLSKDAFAVRISGDSMNKVAQEGEDVIVEPRDRRLIDGKYYVVRNAAGEMTFKRYRENPARLEPCSTNPEHQTIFPGEDGFEIIGRVRKKVSDL
jgi:repressor LexA